MEAAELLHRFRAVVTAADPRNAIEADGRVLVVHGGDRHARFRVDPSVLVAWVHAARESVALLSPESDAETAALGLLLTHMDEEVRSLEPAESYTLTPAGFVADGPRRDHDTHPVVGDESHSAWMGEKRFNA